MTNYYKVPRNSETGHKFEALEKRAADIRKKMNALEEKYGYDGCYTAGQCAYGGIVEVIFPKGKTKTGQEVDIKGTWKNGTCGYKTYAPRARGEGKKVGEDLKSCGVITRFEFNEIMNVKDPFHLIGFAFGSEYIGASLNKKKSEGIPSDAIEITASEYSELFDSKEEQA